jgi:squalene-associated FAD-dependent desaturase
MPSVAVIGGGLAGLATAAALADAGFEIDLYEARNFLGGRATSWPAAGAADGSELIDNCQHILLKCCVNLQDLYRRLGVENAIHFYREFYFLEPGGRLSTLKRGLLPAPMHFLGSFLTLKYLALADKIAISRGMRAILKERHRTDLDHISMGEWLRQKRQTPQAIERYWRPVLISAISEELDAMAAAHGFQVFWLAMMARADAYEMGVPAVPLRELYDDRSLSKLGNIRLHRRSAITAIETAGRCVTAIQLWGERRAADYYVSCLPFERLEPLLPQLPIAWREFTHAPITGIHLWFDRSITDLPHASLLDRTIQWMYNKDRGRYVQLVVSASRSLVEMPRAEVIDLSVRELGEFFPVVKEAKLERAHVVKEVRALFSAKPGLEAFRPQARTPFENFFLAGDWTRTGWPGTMEGAVRSGYIAAEAITAAAGSPRKVLLPDIG